VLQVLLFRAWLTTQPKYASVTLVLDMSRPSGKLLFEESRDGRADRAEQELAADGVDLDPYEAEGFRIIRMGLARDQVETTVV